MSSIFSQLGNVASSVLNAGNNLLSTAQEPTRMLQSATSDLLGGLTGAQNGHKHQGHCGNGSRDQSGAASGICY